jgi:glycosyltransferase involved in cell wall biosynthesis
VNRFYRREFPRVAPLPNRLKAALVGGSIRRAARVVTPSQAVADEVEAAYPSARGRTFAVPEAADAHGGAPVEASPVPRRFPGERLVLVPSFCGPHKNVGTLVDALALLRARDGALAASLRVVFTGSRNADFEAVEARAARLGVGDLLVQTGFVSRGALLGLYREVDLVAYPSLYEGFGLPVVEAQAAGTPLVLADIPVLREVSGGRATFFDPRRPERLAAVLEALLRDPPARQAPGAVHAPRTWDDYAEDLVRHCREVMR